MKKLVIVYSSIVKIFSIKTKLHDFCEKVAQKTGKLIKFGHLFVILGAKKVRVFVSPGDVLEDGWSLSYNSVLVPKVGEVGEYGSKIFWKIKKGFTFVFIKPFFFVGIADEFVFYFQKFKDK